MSCDYEDYKMEIKSRSNVYPLMDRLMRRKGSWFDIFKVVTKDNKSYKVIELTASCPRTRSDGLIRRTVRYLDEYSGSEYVPSVVYHNLRTLIVEWVNGNPLDKIALTEEQYERYGEFVGRSMKAPEVVDVSCSIHKMEEAINRIKERGIIDTTFERDIYDAMKRHAKPPRCIEECVCMADTAVKNFILKNDGRYCYVDVFGVYRAPVGSIFFKQLNAMKKCNRPSFVKGFIRVSPYGEISEHLSFFMLLHLVNRIDAKSRNATKPNITMYNRYVQRKKVSVAKEILKELISARDESCVIDQIGIKEGRH